MNNGRVNSYLRFTMKRLSCICSFFLFLLCLQSICTLAQTADPELLRQEHVAEIRCYRGFEPKRFLERIERYNENGLLVELITVKILGDDQVERNEYDSSNRITSKTITGGSMGSHIQRFEYQYAADGSWKQVRTDLQTPVVCIKHTVSGKKHLTEILKNGKVVESKVAEGNKVTETWFDEKGKWKWKITRIDGIKHTREVRGGDVFKTAIYTDSIGRITKEVERGPECTGMVPQVDQRWGRVSYMKQTITTTTSYTYQYNVAGLITGKRMQYRSICDTNADYDITYDYEYTRR